MITVEDPSVLRAPARPAAPHRPRRTWPWVDSAVLIASIGVFLGLCWRLRVFVTDDSWISVRYAENLAQGHGFVWNPGGPRVEGFSNPLLVIAEALADLIGVPAMLAARGVGVLSGVALLALIHLRGRTVVGRTGASAATLFVACSGPIAFWAVGGLETLPVALVLTAATLELAARDGGRVWPAAGAMALLPWLRPEGLLAAGVLVALSEGRRLVRTAQRRTAFRRLLVLAGVPVASQLLLEGIRLAVYGHLLPNSVLFKAGQGTPFGVADKFLAQGVVVLVLAVVGLALARGRQRLLAVPPAVYLAGSIGMLDNVNGFSRFFLPVWPQLALLAGLGVAGFLSGVDGRRRGRAAVAVLAAGCLALVAAPPGDVRSVVAAARTYADCKTAARTSMAAWLTTTPQDTTFAIVDAGLVPARAGGRTAIESLFLNEALIQETGALSTAEQVDEILQRRPDVLVLASARSDTFASVYPVDQGLHDDPRARDYRLAFVATGSLPTCTYSLMAFTR
ncbi:hypothetical protein [Geodermatophilus sp. URMC 64]